MYPSVGEVSGLNYPNHNINYPLFMSVVKPNNIFNRHFIDTILKKREVPIPYTLKLPLVFKTETKWNISFHS